MFSLRLGDGLELASSEHYLASRPSRQRRGLLQSKFQERLARDADLLTLLCHGGGRSNYCANSRSHSRISSDGANRATQSSSAQYALGRPSATALALHLVIAAQNGIRRAANHNICQLQLQFGLPSHAPRLFGLRHAAGDVGPAGSTIVTPT